MSHGVGVTEALQSLPDAVYLLFALLTQLGDLWFYFLALTLVYAFGESLVDDALSRERVAVVIAIALGALAVVAGLKAFFAHPRPPGAETLRPIAWLPTALVPLVESLATGDGFSLPSGHATGSAAVYAGAALVLRYGRDRTRYLLAAAVIAVVAASRVVLGVHYLGDVLLGVGVGLAYAGLVYWVTDGGANVKRAFTLAVLAAAVAAAVHFSVDTLSALGGALGGRIGWTVFGERAAAGTVTSREGAVAAVVALTVGGVFIGAAFAGETPVVGFVGAGLGLAAVLGAPLAARRVLRKDLVG
ncbi:phosphatase PAP2 family protein [Halorarius litoreus]|uniref:phosphatase PAP2 family protein n=1 Tax=Halorarius litoreus TaxID=2962676 RepID=UPI0020CB90BB|nr:phosphatase PAP2 family protein [Halorarius litoreus]